MWIVGSPHDPILTHQFEREIDRSLSLLRDEIAVGPDVLARWLRERGQRAQCLELRVETIHEIRRIAAACLDADDLEAGKRSKSRSVITLVIAGMSWPVPPSPKLKIGPGDVACHAEKGLALPSNRTIT